MAVHEITVQQDKKIREDVIHYVAHHCGETGLDPFQQWVDNNSRVWFNVSE